MKKYIVVGIIILFIFSGVVLFNSIYVNNSNNDILEDNILEDSNYLEEVIIENEEVNKLYNYVSASLNSNNVCIGYYYQNPLKNHSLEDKIRIVLINYANNYKNEINEEILEKINKDDRNLIINSSKYYIDSIYVKEGMKLIFDIEIDKFDEYSNYYWKYRSDIDAFVEVIGGGGYDAEIVQKIIEYKESDEEIYIVVVKAELGYDNNVYRYVNKKDTLVYENVAEEFRFTKDNIDNFSQIKYIFKKNEEGNYYVSDIINLNYENDFEVCN